MLFCKAFLFTASVLVGQGLATRTRASFHKEFRRLHVRGASDVQAQNAMREAFASGALNKDSSGALQLIPTKKSRGAPFTVAWFDFDPSSLMFELVLDHSSGQDYGIAVRADVTDYMEVRKHGVFGNGLVPTWNAICHLRQVVPNDRITEVDGQPVASKAALMTALAECKKQDYGRVELTFSRAATANFTSVLFHVYFPCQEKRAVGIVLDESLVVHAVEKGIIDDWNRLQAHFIVKDHDRIVQVNEEKGGRDAQLKAMGTLGIVRLMFYRELIPPTKAFSETKPPPTARSEARVDAVTKGEVAANELLRLMDLFTYCQTWVSSVLVENMKSLELGGPRSAELAPQLMTPRITDKQWPPEVTQIFTVDKFFNTWALNVVQLWQNGKQKEGGILSLGYFDGKKQEDFEFASFKFGTEGIIRRRKRLTVSNHDGTPLWTAFRSREYDGKWYVQGAGKFDKSKALFTLTSYGFGQGFRIVHSRANKQLYFCKARRYRLQGCWHSEDAWKARKGMVAQAIGNYGYELSIMPGEDIGLLLTLMTVSQYERQFLEDMGNHWFYGFLFDAD